MAPPAVIGTNTVEAIQSGIMLGEADRVDGLVRRIFDQLGYPAKVIATGGLAPVVERSPSTIDEVNTEADAGRPPPYRRSRLPPSVGRGCLREPPQ